MDKSTVEPVDEMAAKTVVSECRNHERCKGKAKAIEVAGDIWFRGCCERCIADLDEEELLIARTQATAGLLSSAPARLKDWSLSTYPRDSDGEEALEDGLAWLEAFRAGPCGNLVLHGSVGSGKSGLAWSIAREVAEVDGIKAVFVNWRDLLDALRASFRGGQSQDVVRIRRAHLLILDDLGAERPTDFARDELATLTEFRYGEKLPTIITSNYPPSKLAERLGHDDLVIGERIVSRLTDGAMVVHLTAKDRRR